MASAIKKILLKKNAVTNGLELKKILQGLTVTDVTHSPVASLCFYSYSSYFFSFFFPDVSTFFPISAMTYNVIYL